MTLGDILVAAKVTAASKWATSKVKFDIRFEVYSLGGLHMLIASDSHFGYN